MYVTEQKCRPYEFTLSVHNLVGIETMKTDTQLQSDVIAELK